MQTNTAYKQKGATLVEVLVALSVFLIVMGTLVAGYLSIKKMIVKQKEYVYFEAVCLDIGKYRDLYGKKWDEKYFGAFLVKDTANNGGTETPDAANPEGTNPDGTENNEPNRAETANNGGTAYFNAKFSLCEAENGMYRLTYLYNEKGELVLNIQNTRSNYFVINNLNYGDPAATVKTEVTP